LEIASLPVDEFARLEKCSDVPILIADSEGLGHFIEADAVTAAPCALNHCSAHISAKECDGKSLVVACRCSAEITAMTLEVIIPLQVIEKAMDLRHISPAFA